MDRVLSTIGYEKASLDDFLATLQLAEITVLIDVRDYPGSRRPGFSKNALRDAAESVGIQYIHLKGLGDPKEGRYAARQGDFSRFKKIFSAQMKTPEAVADLEKVRAILTEKKACLMCYERDHKSCHRKIIADMVANLDNVKIQPLGVRVGLSIRDRKRQTRQSAHAGEGVAACG